MTLGPNERIRRILGDGPSPLPSSRPRKPVLREMPGPTPPVSDALRERLALLDKLSSRSHPARTEAPSHVDEPALRGPLAPPAPPREPEEASGDITGGAIDDATADDATADDATIEERIGGRERVTPVGTCWERTWHFPLAASHGHVCLGDALARPVPLRRGEGWGRHASALDLSQAVFLDTETTGLAGGAGTVAFLVGLGWVEGDTFVVRQLLMRDYPEEAAMLHAVWQDIDDRALVTFNGRGYDWPLLVTRWHLNRTEGTRGHAAAPRPHLDLLVPARRLWARTLPSRRLASLERHVLGLARGEDLSGASIPSAWFHFLRTGWSGDMERACLHNRIDIVSLLALAARMSEVLDTPEDAMRHPTDPRGKARWLIELDRLDEARRCLEAGLSGAGERGRLDIRRDLATLCRRASDPAAALVHWQSIARSTHHFDCEAYEHVAKIYEHHIGDLDQAVRWTVEALQRAAHDDSRSRAALEHRLARLERKRRR